MNLADELRSASRWAAAEAGVGFQPAFARPHQALQRAARSLGQAWCGSWLPGFASFYERRLHPLPPSLRLAADADLVNPRPELMTRCRVWTPQQIRDVVCQMAGAPDMQRLDATASRAVGCLGEARQRFAGLLERAGDVAGGAAELATLAATARGIQPPEREQLIHGWRPVYRRAQTGQELMFETPPPHIAELARLEAQMGTFQGLQQFAQLLQCVAQRARAPTRWRALFTPHLLARQLEFRPES